LRLRVPNQGKPQMFSNVIDFAKALYVICRIEAGPQKLPFSTPLLAIAAVVYILVRLWEESFDQPVIAAGFLGVFDILLLALMVGIPLWLFNLSNRIPQTLTALTSAGIVVSIVNIFLLFLLSDLPLPPERLGRVIALLTFPLLLWRLFINANLLRHALSWRFRYAIALSLIHILTVIFIGGSLASALAK
jgi:hypothetical protein